MAPKPGTTLTVEDGVAIVTLVNPPVNALHPDVLQSMFNHLMEAHNRRDVEAIVITGAGGKFCAGFDIAQFASGGGGGGGGIDGRINDAFVRLVEDGPKPTVAAVAGLALGGGCEIAIACNARVAAPGTAFGLPELTLGIIPGFGGTQRLPRLIGVAKAAEMMLTSKPVKAEAALKLGLVDAIAPADALLAAAKARARDVAAGRAPRLRTLYRTDRVEGLAEALATLAFVRAQAAKRAPGLRHPLLCLDAIQHGIEHGGAAGLLKEGECFAAAAALDTHRALVHIFFAQRATKRVRGVTDAGLSPRPIRRVAVLGGGLMGSGIATACVLAGVEVLLKEVSQQFLDAGLGRVRANLASRVKKGRMPEAAAAAALARLAGALDYSRFKEVDMVIEAVIEDVGLKQRIFADLAAACGPDCILSSNTSTIDISLIYAKVPAAAPRVLGAHFFSPAHVMPLLEIVRTDKTAPQVVLDTLAFAAAIKKTPVVVGNCTGFAVNRVFFPYTQAACLLADLGAPPAAVDAAIAAFGMPMGPFRLSDLVGADVGLHVGANIIGSFPKRSYPARVIKLLVDAKRLGEKTGAGFYKYDARRRPAPDPDFAPILEASRREAGLGRAAFDVKTLSPQDVAEFILFPVVNEGCRVIDEGIVEKPADLDVATVMAMGFPAPRGGLIFWADLVGAERIRARLAGWAAQFEPVGLGGFFKPCAYLERAAAEGRKLGEGRRGAAKM